MSDAAGHDSAEPKSQMLLSMTLAKSNFFCVISCEQLARLKQLVCCWACPCAISTRSASNFKFTDLGPISSKDPVF